MTEINLRAVEFAVRDSSRPLLLLGPSLGTSISALWGVAAGALVDRFDVVGWELPGHGVSERRLGAAADGLQMGDLASAVLRVVDRVQAIRGDRGAPFYYAGVSVAGCVGLQLLIDHPERLSAAALICTAAQIGSPEGWLERASFVESAGAASQISASAQRWFGPDFVQREPGRSSELLHSLRETEAAGYAAVCRALASFDARAELAVIQKPVLVISGAHDQATPAEQQRMLAAGISGARLETLSAAAHLAPAEQPAEVAQLLAEFFLQAHSGVGVERLAGQRVRRQILGDAHVERAEVTAGEFGADFQELINAYAWGSIWTRPGLDRRSRSIITLTALTANAHWEELTMHLKAARGNGLSWQEIKEVLLQCAIYCSVPNANNAFKLAGQIYREEQETA